MNGYDFMVGLGLISTVGWLGNTWIRTRHGVKPEAKPENDDKPDNRRLDAISTENSELKQHVRQLQERMAVMERIATDPAERTAREIESLR